MYLNATSVQFLFNFNFYSIESSKSDGRCLGLIFFEEVESPRPIGENDKSSSNYIHSKSRKSYNRQHAPSFMEYIQQKSQAANLS